ncbi:unnamed protein product [Heligmosomoides polygyrus]|uniref:ShKT domain-containing protein n=1 Tax=Heligmosomoides polygyrus TaxID=6339 RepID=A0A183F2W8_HELPZ|nr:unnamed protein product [Heligmosomoides polygyrus]
MASCWEFWELLNTETTVTAPVYAAQLHSLADAMRQKRPGLGFINAHTGPPPSAKEGDGCLCANHLAKESNSCFKPTERWANKAASGKADLSKCPDDCANGDVMKQLNNQQIKMSLFKKQPCFMKCPCLCPDFCEDRDSFEKTKCPSELTAENLVICGIQYEMEVHMNASSSASASLTSAPKSSDTYLPSSSETSHTVETSTDPVLNTSDMTMPYASSQKTASSTSTIQAKIATTTEAPISSKQQESTSSSMLIAFDSTPSKSGKETLASLWTSKAPPKETEAPLDTLTFSEQNDKTKISTQSSSVLTTTHAAPYEVTRSSDPSVDHASEVFFPSQISSRTTGAPTSIPKMSDQPTTAYETTGKAAINYESTTSLFLKKVTTVAPTQAVSSRPTGVQNMKTLPALHSTRSFTENMNALYMISTRKSKVPEEIHNAFHTSSVAYAISRNEQHTSSATKSTAQTDEGLTELQQVVETGHRDVPSTTLGQLSPTMTGFLMKSSSTPRTSKPMLSNTMTHETDERRTAKNVMITTDPAPTSYRQSASSPDSLKTSPTTQPTKIITASKESYDDKTIYTDNSIQAVVFCNLGKNSDLADEVDLRNGEVLELLRNAR